MRVCMLAGSLAGGGAERALLDTGALLASRGHEVGVLTLEDTGSDQYPVPPMLSRVALGLPRRSANRIDGLINNIRRILAIRAYARRTGPDVVISYLTRANILCLLALAGTRVPTVATEHNPPGLRDAPLHGLWNALRRTLYRRAAQVVVVSRGLAEHYRWIDPGKLSVIYNFLSPERGRAQETFGFLAPGCRYIVGTGRLEHQKRFDVLIEAFKRIEGDCPGWNLLILGEGSLRPSLTALVDSLGLKQRVAMPGRVADPRAVFGRCDIFVLSSENEGFGLVLVEAMSVGLPVVSFDCDFGPREIIAHGVSGLLVPPGDVAALAQTMGNLVADSILRERLASGGLEAVRQFDPDAILPQWEDLLRRVRAPASMAK